MKIKSSFFIFALLLAALGMSQVAQADIITSGDVDPADPSTWTSSTEAVIGDATAGSVIVNNGSDIFSGKTYLSGDGGGSGEVTITGAGSTWTISSYLKIGRYGSGTLNITDGGVVNSSSGTSLGLSSDSTGVVNVDGDGSAWTLAGSLAIGYSTNGTLNITNGGGVTCSGSTFLVGGRFASSATGEVNVDGTGSTLTWDGRAYIGDFGTGTLNITGGGTVVSNDYVAVGAASGAQGTVMVEGTGSTWTLASDTNLVLGYNDNATGTVHIRNGGTISADINTMYLNSRSLLSVDAGSGSSLTLTGELHNEGTIRLLAGAQASAGDYSPITAGSWDDDEGTYQGVGGMWDAANHVFTVSAAETAASGESVEIDLASTQRILVTDQATGWTLGASFLATDSSSILDVTAEAITGSELDGLEALMDPGESILEAWDVETASGYTSGDPAYLSFDIGSDFTLSLIQIWYYDGSDWSEYDAADLSYDGNYASFTVTDFSGYAVTGAPVPVPAAVWLLGSGLAGLIGIRRRAT